MSTQGDTQSSPRLPVMTRSKGGSSRIDSGKQDLGRENSMSFTLALPPVADPSAANPPPTPSTTVSTTGRYVGRTPNTRGTPLSLHRGNAGATMFCIARGNSMFLPLRNIDTGILRAGKFETDDNAQFFVSGTNEQGQRASIRQVALDMGIHIELANKRELELLKDAGIIGKRAPCAGLIEYSDAVRFILGFGFSPIANTMRDHYEDICRDNEDASCLATELAVPVKLAALPTNRRGAQDSQRSDASDKDLHAKSAEGNAGDYSSNDQPLPESELPSLSARPQTTGLTPSSSSSSSSPSDAGPAVPPGFTDINISMCHVRSSNVEIIRSIVELTLPASPRQSRGSSSSSGHGVTAGGAVMLGMGLGGGRTTLIGGPRSGANDSTKGTGSQRSDSYKPSSNDQLQDTLTTESLAQRRTRRSAYSQSDISESSQETTEDEDKADVDENELSPTRRPSRRRKSSGSKEKSPNQRESAALAPRKATRQPSNALKSDQLSRTPSRGGNGNNSPSYTKLHPSSGGKTKPTRSASNRSLTASDEAQDMSQGSLNDTEARELAQEVSRRAAAQVAMMHHAGGISGQVDMSGQGTIAPPGTAQPLQNQNQLPPTFQTMPQSQVPATLQGIQPLGYSLRPGQAPPPMMPQDQGQAQFPGQQMGYTYPPMGYFPPGYPQYMYDATQGRSLAGQVQQGHILGPAQAVLPQFPGPSQPVQSVGQRHSPAYQFPHALAGMRYPAEHQTDMRATGTDTATTPLQPPAQSPMNPTVPLSLSAHPLSVRHDFRSNDISDKADPQQLDNLKGLGEADDLQDAARPSGQSTPMMSSQASTASTPPSSGMNRGIFALPQAGGPTHAGVMGASPHSQSLFGQVQSSEPLYISDNSPTTTRGKMAHPGLSALSSMATGGRQKETTDGHSLTSTAGQGTSSYELGQKRDRPKDDIGSPSSRPRKYALQDQSLGRGTLDQRERESSSSENIANTGGQRADIQEGSRESTTSHDTSLSLLQTPSQRRSSPVPQPRQNQNHYNYGNVDLRNMATESTFSQTTPAASSASPSHRPDSPPSASSEYDYYALRPSSRQQSRASPATSSTFVRDALMKTAGQSAQIPTSPYFEARDGTTAPSLGLPSTTLSARQPMLHGGLPPPSSSGKQLPSSGPGSLDKTTHESSRRNIQLWRDASPAHSPMLGSSAWNSPMLSMSRVPSAQFNATANLPTLLGATEVDRLSAHAKTVPSSSDSSSSSSKHSVNTPTRAQ